MTYQKALACIHSLDVFGSKPGLERIGELLNRIGNPQNKLKFVHVAGTNGKGSVCVMLSNILEKSGYKTGLYISPFITDFRERIQINNKMVSQSLLAEAVEKIFPVVEQMAKENLIITEFELVCAVAFYCFLKEGCDIVVLETGLGGRFDATNVINCPLCSVITHISLDHTAILGNTLKQIAFEKSGIIKENGICVVARQEQEAMDEITNNARLKNNRMFFGDDIDISVLNGNLLSNDFLYNNQKIQLSLQGNHQLDNVKTVLCVTQVLNNYCKYIIPDNAIKAGLENVVHPARLEIISKNPLVVLDGAHNPDGITALKNYIVEKIMPISGHKKLICIIGMLSDKDSESSIEILGGIFSTVIAVPINNPRSLTASQLAEKCRGHFENVIACEQVDKAFDMALNISKASNTPIIICGSLYLAGEIRPYITQVLQKTK